MERQMAAAAALPLCGGCLCCSWQCGTGSSRMRQPRWRVDHRHVGTGLHDADQTGWGQAAMGAVAPGDSCWLEEVEVTVRCGQCDGVLGGKGHGGMAAEVRVWLEL